MSNSLEVFRTSKENWPSVPSDAPLIIEAANRRSRHRLAMSASLCVGSIVATAVVGAAIVASGREATGELDVAQQSPMESQTGGLSDCPDATANIISGGFAANEIATHSSPTVAAKAALRLATPDRADSELTFTETVSGQFARVTVTNEAEDLIAVLNVRTERSDAESTSWFITRLALC